MASLRIYQGNVLKEKLEFLDGELTIGRAPDNDVVLGESGVSGHHAIIVQEGDRFWIEDKGSTNGVYVNGVKLEGKGELKYWEEVQILSFVLKLVAVSGHLEDQDVGAVDTPFPDKTMIVDLSTKQQLEKMKRRRKVAFISHRDGKHEEQAFPLEDAKFTIGRARGSDVRVGGWFAPAHAATVQHSGFGYILTPDRRGKVEINGEVITSSTKLKDGDNFKVRKAQFRFYFDVLEGD